MTLVPFLAITFGAGAASLLARRSPELSAGIGIVGLVAAVVTAAALRDDAAVAIGGSELVGSAYLRLFTLLGSTVALLLAIIGLATSSHRSAPGVMLTGIGAAGLALALPDARIAVLAATAGGLVGILVTLATPAAARGVVVAVRELRALAIAGLLAILAAAWIGRPLEELAARPAVFGLAYLGFAVAVAIRWGAIPFHFWAARLADAAPEVTLPMAMAWGPGAFAIVALAWADQSVAPLLIPLTVERSIVIAIGAVSIILGSLAAWIQDDLEHVVGYTIIADAGVAILGLAALDPAAWEPARTWVIVFVMVRSAFAAWAVAVRHAFGTRRISELRGWALRAPMLAVALAVIVVAGVGWPGLLAWDARAALIDLSLDGPLFVLVTVGALAPLAVYARLAYVGIGSRSDAVARGGSQRPTWPAPLPSRPMLGSGGLERAFERSGHALAGVLDVLWVVPAGLRINRTPIAGALVLTLAALAFVVSAGGLGVQRAASAVQAPISGPSGSQRPDSGPQAPGASEMPGVETEPPGTGPSFRPLPTP
jgi:NADH:ubiquinone oxidoreductase subunit 2 (subunit N)